MRNEVERQIEKKSRATNFTKEELRGEAESENDKRKLILRRKGKGEPTEKDLDKGGEGLGGWQNL